VRAEVLARLLVRRRAREHEQRDIAPDPAREREHLLRLERVDRLAGVRAERERALRPRPAEAGPLAARDHQHGDAAVPVRVLARLAQLGGPCLLLRERHDLRRLDGPERRRLGRMHEFLPVDLREPAEEPLARVGGQLVEPVEQVLLAVAREGGRLHGRGS
jgi:hypothetical protein